VSFIVAEIEGGNKTETLETDSEREKRALLAASRRGYSL
jgi:hypothetical protein